MLIWFKFYEIQSYAPPVFIDETVLNLIVDKALEFKLGARGLRGICEAIMTDLMYSLPSEEKPIKQFTITLDYALEKLKNAKLNQLKVA